MIYHKAEKKTDAPFNECSDGSDAGKCPEPEKLLFRM